MVATIDGKIVNGMREENVIGLGSKLDQQLMDRIERAADAIILGAGSVRANPHGWSPHCPVRIAVTESGNVDWTMGYFREQAYVACSQRATYPVPPHVKRLAFGAESLDLPALLRHLRHEMGIERLHLLGGSELNAEFLSRDLADELFMTVAPKIKLGRDLPTYAGGEPLPRDGLLRFEIVEHHVVDDEIFVRYRRRR